ncbi:MAG: hypothetical protein R3Y58_03285 [Eubacteriales bacterium]
MLKKDKLIAMTKMSMYNSGKKKESLQIVSYYKLDYIALQTIITLLWVTVGFCIVAAGGVAWKIDEILSGFSIDSIMELLIMIGGVYIVVLLIFGMISIMFYNEKYRAALQVAKEYYHTLGLLNTMYKKEN